MTEPIRIKSNEKQVIESYFKYDGISWSGLCLYQGQLYYYKSVDETDYETARKNCPFCSAVEEGDDDIEETPRTPCTCINYAEVYSYLTPVGFWTIFWIMIKRSIWG